MSSKNKKYHHNQNHNNNQSNQHHNDFEKKSFDKNQDKNNSNKHQIDNKQAAEINKMNEEIKLLSSKITRLEEENFKYKTEIAKINADYIKKIMQKSTEAQELVKAKQTELDEKFKVELDSQIVDYIF